ncbi:MAG: protein-disulfide reductase DsbD domain-containing protein [Bacteroidota bacterium]
MKSLIGLLGILFIVNTSFAQFTVPVTWEKTSNKINDQEYELIFTATIEPGWTIYSQTVEDGPIPTSVFFVEGDHFELIGSTEEDGESKEGFDPVFETNVKKFFNTAVFKQRVKVLDFSKPITGDVEYMCCDDKQCLPPTQDEFSFLFEETTEAPTTTLSTDDQPTLSIDNDSKPKSNKRDKLVWNADVEKLSGNKYQVNLHADIQEGWHIYSQYLESDQGPTATSVFFEENEGVKPIGKVEEKSPERIEGFDDIFEMNVVKLKKKVTFSQEFELTDPNAVIEGDVSFQACDTVRCLPKITIPFRVDFPAKKVWIDAEYDAFKESQTAALPVDESYLAGLFQAYAKPDLSNPAANCNEEIVEDKSSLWNIFILGFLGGLVALLTPCVFPIIPLTVSFFTKAQGASNKKGIVNASLYGFFIFFIYFLLSIPFHLLDSIDPNILNTISTNPILNIVFFAIFIFFAFSFFGYYELTLPSSWSTRASSAEGVGGIIGIFFMALTLALVSFSCTGPILGSLLAGALTATGGAMQLTVGMSAFGLALALPFALFAAFPSWMNSLPKSGGWLNTVKVVLGFVELALALKFLSNADMVKHWGLLKYEVFNGLWIVIALATAAYLFGLIKFPHDSPMKKLPVSRAILAVGFLGFAIYMTTGFMYDKKADSYKSLKLLSGLAPPVCYSWFRPCDCPQNLNCYKDFFEGQEVAANQNKPILIDFTGYACVNCRKMEEHVWPEKQVYDKLSDDYVLVSLYVDDRKPLPKEEQITVTDWRGKQKDLETYGDKWTHFQFKYFENVSQPYYILLSPDGKRILNNPVGYTPDITEYASFLECGIQANERLTSSKLLGEK